MKRLILAVIALVVLVAAAQPADVAPTLRAQGFYVESGSNANPAAVESAVEEARFEGGALSVAVLAEEPGGGATIFAENTLNAMGGTGTVFVVSPETAGWASEGDIYSREQLDAATDASLDGGSDTEVVELFVSTLIDKPVGESEPGGGGGFPWGLVILAVIVAGIAFIIWKASQSSKRAKQQSIDAARAEVKKRLDDVANDIIDLEDEVATSEDPAVSVLYASATEAYTKALGSHEHATSPDELMVTAEDLDMAIWRLDSVEALLDGQPVPPKPEKPKPKPKPTAAVSGSPLTAPPRVPPTVYRRPDRRRSSGTAAMMAGMLLGSAGSSRRSSHRSSGSSSKSKSSSSARMRGGGRRRG
jgi:hypothetical protein